MSFHVVPDEDISGVFHIYDNGIRCAAAPCPNYTVRHLSGDVYKASSYGTTQLAPYAGDWLGHDLYLGRWLVRGTLARAEWHHTVSCELRVEQLVAPVETAAAELVSTWLRNHKSLQPLLRPLRDATMLLAQRAQHHAVGQHRLYATRLLDWLGEVEAMYATYRPPSTYGPQSPVLDDELAEYLGDLVEKVITASVLRHTGGIDPLVAAWLLQP